MTQEKFEKTLSLLKGVLDYESFKDVDIVIEVVRKACCFWFTLILLENKGKRSEIFIFYAWSRRLLRRFL